MDTSKEKNALFFAGNYMSFVHRSLDVISGELEVFTENGKLEITYYLSFLGQTFFLGTLLLVCLFSRNEFPEASWLLIVPVGFAFQLLMGSIQFNHIIKTVGNDISQMKPNE
jgi:hypothetical protein